MTIREHPLAWRWTQADHTLLPDATLARMFPIEESGAAHWWKRSVPLVTNNGLNPAEFSSIVQHRADVALDIGRDWLLEQQPELGAPVVISWDNRMAIRTTWDIFTTHWDAFCYPSSDDVLIFPDSMRWVLFFFHEEEFQFGRRLMMGAGQENEPD